QLSKLFTTAYVSRINANLVAPAKSVLIKPNELGAALARPLHLAAYEPYHHLSTLAAAVSYGIIRGEPF
ncbi:hypothetical protein K435DRAFT_573198, partial [Dendrothele bispora CBS 962.96]